MMRSAMWCLALSLAAGCVIQQPPPQQSHRQNALPSTAAPGATAPYGYTPRSNTRWSNLGDAPNYSTANVDPASVSRDGIEQPIRGFSGATATGFRVAYGKSSDAALDEVRKAFESERVFETIAAELNNLIKIPGIIDIQLVDCGTVNAFYDQNSSRIIVCYEFVSYLAKMFQTQLSDEAELGKAVIGATMFAFFHELGHALRHQLDLPLTGKEEDAVDQLATLILMEGGDEGVRAALAGAYWFLLQGSQANAAELPFWDEHSLDHQRFYNIACLVYGSDRVKYAKLVSDQFLPEARAKRCGQEYLQISGAWDKLLAPHRRSPTAATSTTSTRSTTPDPQPTGGGGTCQDVADHAIRLALEASGISLDALSEQELILLETQVVQLRETAIEQCQTERWPRASRACVLRARTMAEAESCGI